VGRPSALVALPDELGVRLLCDARELDCDGVGLD
jgi:hypothetical protein